jgi:hypothetical protein
MEKEMIAEKDMDAQQGILFPELAEINLGIGKQKTGKKNRRPKNKTQDLDSQVENMSPNEFVEFLRNRDKLRYEKAKLILQEESTNE